MSTNTKHECTNADVKIVQLTDDVIDAVCEKCGKTGHAERKDYFDFEWNRMYRDAQTKHEMYSEEPNR